MIKNLVVGSGFSAVITKTFLGKNSRIIGFKKKFLFRNQNFFRRKSLDINKLLSKKTISYGSLKFELNKGKLHDRLILGGNSTIWGGHINLKKLTKKIMSFFEKKIKLVKLDYNRTGAIANDKNIHQLQSYSGNILNSNDIFTKIEDGYILSFFVRKKKIYIKLINRKKKKINKIQVNKLFICIGTIQFLDLLYRSQFLKNGDLIEYSEYHHKFIISNIYSKLPKGNATVIRYKFSRAIGHFLGIQYYSKFLRLLDFIPLSIDQCFYKKKLNYKLSLKNGELIEKNNSKSFDNFGQSIHYCNLKINKIPINQIIKKIHPNIYGIGMCFIDQDIPGPISNDIILDSYKKTINI